jgi:hypothetical protein
MTLIATLTLATALVHTMGIKMNITGTDPRFEYRIFGPNLEHIAQTIMTLYPVKDRDEGLQTYILSPTNQAHNVKIRNDKLDMKILLRHYRGLERWRPYLQLSFPLSAAFLHEFMFAWLEVDPPCLMRSCYSAYQLLHELIIPNSYLKTVQVYKQRQHYTIHRCQVEVASLLVNGRQQVDTIAIEATDADSVLRTVELFGLDASSNTNYLAGLHRLLTNNSVTNRVHSTSNGHVAAVNGRELVLAR